MQFLKVMNCGESFGVQRGERSRRPQVGIIETTTAGERADEISFLFWNFFPEIRRLQ